MLTCLLSAQGLYLLAPDVVRYAVSVIKSEARHEVLVHMYTSDNMNVFAAARARTLTTLQRHKRQSAPEAG